MIKDHRIDLHQRLFEAHGEPEDHLKILLTHGDANGQN